jgi:hypothetical protein
MKFVDETARALSKLKFGRYPSQFQLYATWGVRRAGCPSGTRRTIEAVRAAQPHPGVKVRASRLLTSCDSHLCDKTRSTRARGMSSRRV